MMNKFGLSLLTMFGIGHIKYAPGTMASFITCLIYYFLFSIDVNFYYFFLIFVILLIYSIILIDKLSHYFKEKDPKEIVIDEFFGLSIPFVIVMFIYTMPLTEAWTRNLEFEVYYFFLFFILFRFFDIYKPFPINIIDKKMKNGFGVMLDDIMAGVYTFIVFYIGVLFYIYSDFKWIIMQKK